MQTNLLTDADADVDDDVRAQLRQEAVATVRAFLTGFRDTSV